MTATEQLNALAATWGGVMLRGLIEATIFLVVVIGLWLPFRKKMPAELSYGLFLLVLLKLAVPVPITAPAQWLRYWPATAVEGLVRWTGAADDGGRLDPLGRPIRRSRAVTVRNSDVIPPSVATMPQSTIPRPSQVSALAWLMIVWAAVAIVMLASLITRHVAMHLRLRGARRLDSGDLPVSLTALARRARLRSSIRLLEVPWIGSPAVWGLLRPCVLVPPGIDTSLSANGMTWVLLHELTHIRRRDVWVTLFQRLVQIAYFFHPAVWAANRMIDVFREYACDDAATACAGVPRYDCGTGFLSIVERANKSPVRSSPALGMIRSKALIRSRLMRILDGRRPLSTGLSLGSAALLLVVAAVGLPRLRAREEPAKPAPAPTGREASRPIAATPLTKGSEAQEKEKAEAAAAKVVSGIVHDRDGRPVAEVLIKGTERYREIMFNNGVLDDFVRHDWLSAVTGPDGRYRFEGGSMKRTNPPIKEFGVFAYHKKGYARQSADELRRSGNLTLEPWGRVEGVVTVLGKPLAHVPVRFMLDATDQHSMFYDVFEYETKTDAQGRFAVEHVPAGVAHAVTGTVFGKDPGPYGSVSSAKRLIKAGETLTLNIGGSGRLVVGKLRVLEGIPVSLGGGNLALKTNEKPAPPEASVKVNDGAITEDEREQLFLRHFNAYRSPEGLSLRLAQRFYSVQIHTDGTFRAVEVEPGAYTLSFWVGEDFQHPIATRELVVPPIPEWRNDTPIDLGTIKITPPAPKR